ncbi:MAG: YkgJ family cysteine cluster protein [Halioglobus sp.]
MADAGPFHCRSGCGACCIAPSINQPFFGMPGGKRAGEACIHLDEQMRCVIFNDPRRPALCEAFRAELFVCGDNRDQALVNITRLEVDSTPGGVVQRD